MKYYLSKITTTISIIVLYSLSVLASENEGDAKQNNQTLSNKGPIYTLTYFNARARAEYIRWVLTVANQSFQDVRVDLKDWEKLKPSFPFQQLPVLNFKNDTINITIAQSGAIARFLASRFNMTGKNEIEAAYAHMYSDQINDLFDQISSTYAEYKATNDTDLLFSLLNETLPLSIKYFEERLTKNNGFLSGTNFTYADLHLISILDLFTNEQRTGVLKSFPKIANLDQRVRKLPQIIAWLRKRPKTDL